MFSPWVVQWHSIHFGGTASPLFLFHVRMVRFRNKFPWISVRLFLFASYTLSVRVASTIPFRTNPTWLCNIKGELHFLCDKDFELYSITVCTALCLFIVCPRSNRYGWTWCGRHSCLVDHSCKERKSSILGLWVKHHVLRKHCCQVNCFKQHSASLLRKELLWPFQHAHWCHLYTSSKTAEVWGILWVIEFIH